MTRMYKEYYDANAVPVERIWAGGGVSLKGSHVTLPNFTALKWPEPVEIKLVHRI